jgi:hypothetical protein
MTGSHALTTVRYSIWRSVTLAREPRRKDMRV